jgi:hypothetical protein
MARTPISARSVFMADLRVVAGNRSAAGAKRNAGNSPVREARHWAEPRRPRLAPTPLRPCIDTPFVSVAAIR